MIIAITGANGYIGSQLAQKLIAIGHQVQVYTRPKYDVIESNFIFNEVDHIVHLAALTSVVESWENFSDYIKVNVIGTQRILDSARKNNTPLTFLSSYVYGQPQFLPIDESHSRAPYNPYSLTKIFGEELCEFYQEVYDQTISIIRPFNVYGPGQGTRFVIGSIIDQIYSNSNHISLKSLEPRRDYIYIDDLLSLILKTILLPQKCIVNACSGESYSVEELAIICQKVSGIKKNVISSNSNRKNEVDEIIGSNLKAKEVFNWEPIVGIEDGISLVIQNIKEYVNGK
ncbi:NAD-dependent epimerase/dehydratase family protein [Arachidicoccus terrestris]|uniref:NAD-dependent epimerase/dehydratase family protein n=1 Tax=Arachidicoccus terrestris TaxID=2875539 RepID=UPI001CC7AC95|nr:NAD(P)-dependent oxidoreductase [Arachidicoccus terrestris]UAY55459.1 NAD(P)-dependent oxidoreductase [Arachidicoccus terrestris]